MWSPADPRVTMPDVATQASAIVLGPGAGAAGPSALAWINELTNVRALHVEDPAALGVLEIVEPARREVLWLAPTRAT